MDWNPDQYMKSSDYRMRPALDFLARIELDTPQQVYNLGYGTGSTTKLLARRWSGVQIIGIDCSFEMLERPPTLYPEMKFIEAELSKWNPGTRASKLTISKS